MIVSQRERRPELQTVVPDDLDGFLVTIEAAGKIGCLLHSAQIPIVERLEADHKTDAAATDQQVHQFAIARHVDAALRDPTHLERDERAAQLLGRFKVGQ